MASFASFEKIHQEACRNNEHTYIDPDTGYMVFTEIAHRERGKCCGSGCRHCPYEFENLKDSHALMKPTWLHKRVPSAVSSSSSSSSSSTEEGMGRGMKVLFWSGGKDSFLSLRALLRTGSITSLDALCLLTTYDARLKVVANQELEIDVIG